MTAPRFRLVTDDSCHNYIIPADKLEEWDEFIANPLLPFLEEPDWAVRVDGTSRLTFTDPKED